MMKSGSFRKIEGDWKEDRKYFVNKEGRVFQLQELKRTRRKGLFSPRITLRRKDGTTQLFAVDKIVCKAFQIHFKGKSPKHKDGNPENCSAGNLE